MMDNQPQTQLASPVRKSSLRQSPWVSPWMSQRVTPQISPRVSPRNSFLAGNFHKRCNSQTNQSLKKRVSIAESQPLSIIDDVAYVSEQISEASMSADEENYSQSMMEALNFNSKQTQTSIQRIPEARLE